MERRKPTLYCPKCWQQFSLPIEHGRGAYLGGTVICTEALRVGEQIAKPCTETRFLPIERTVKHRFKKEPPPALDLGETGFKVG